MNGQRLAENGFVGTMGCEIESKGHEGRNPRMIERCRLFEYDIPANLNVFIAAMVDRRLAITRVRTTIAEMDTDRGFFAIGAKMRVRIRRAHDEQRQCDETTIDLPGDGG